MKWKWKYFIVLCTDDCYGDFVESAEEGEGLLVCNDVAVAISFSSTDELIKWVNENTSLKVENGDYKMEGQYLPCEL